MGAWSSGLNSLFVYSTAVMLGAMRTADELPAVAQCLTSGKTPSRYGHSSLHEEGLKLDTFYHAANQFQPGSKRAMGEWQGVAARSIGRPGSNAAGDTSAEPTSPSASHALRMASPS